MFVTTTKTVTALADIFTSVTKTQTSKSRILYPGILTQRIRPATIGYENDVPYQVPITGNHLDKIQEVVSDGDATYVYQVYEEWARDIFYTSAVETTDGSIIRVIVKVKARVSGTPLQTSLKLSIGKFGGVSQDSAAITVTTAYVEYSAEWSINPWTHVAWTWDDIYHDGAAQLEIGYSIRTANPSMGYTMKVTQLYADVESLIMSKTTTSKANVKATVSKTTLALGSMATTIVKTTSAVANLIVYNIKTAASKARVFTAIVKTSTALADIQASLTKTVTALAYIMLSTTRITIALARIQINYIKTVTAKASIVIYWQFLKTSAAKARMKYSFAKTCGAKAFIFTTWTAPKPRLIFRRYSNSRLFFRGG
jgi:hypothetical protein